MSAPDKPQRVEFVEEYWADEPPERSERCAYWVARIRKGWRPNRRLVREGYHASADIYGIYIWEYCKVVSPLLRSLGAYG